VAAGLLLASPALASDCTLIDAIDADPDTLSDAKCTEFLGQTGQTGASCHWEFPLRDTIANRLATELWEALQSCRVGAAAHADRPVNHPDSYDLRTWNAKDAAYSVSIKDKIGQARTLVFLRRETRP
jgi:hypothetical protein